MAHLHSSLRGHGIAPVVLIMLISSPSFSQVDEKPEMMLPTQQPESTMSVTLLTKPIDQKTMTDADWLYLHGRVPKGITYEETKRLFPNLGELRTEGGGAFDSKYGLYEAQVSIKIFDYPATIEFNFRGDDKSQSSLYGFYFGIWDIDSVTAEVLFSRVRDFYTNLYGKCREERETFEYFYESCTWDADVITPSLVKNVFSADRAYIGW